MTSTSARWLFTENFSLSNLIKIKSSLLWKCDMSTKGNTSIQVLRLLPCIQWLIAASELCKSVHLLQSMPLCKCHHKVTATDSTWKRNQSEGTWKSNTKWTQPKDCINNYMFLGGRGKSQTLSFSSLCCANIIYVIMYVSKNSNERLAFTLTFTKSTKFRDIAAIPWLWGSCRGAGGWEWQPETQAAVNGRVPEKNNVSKLMEGWNQFLWKTTFS